MMFRWNSWNHFGCDINESLIRDTGIYALHLHYDVLQVISYIYKLVDLICILLYYFSRCNGVNRPYSLRVQIY